MITFHAIDDAASPLSYPAAALDRLLGALTASGVPIRSLDALLSDPGPGVALTFDDGIASLHDAALPILAAHRAPAHLFLTTGVVGGDNRWETQPAEAESYRMLTWGQIEALHAAGVAIEGHTASHPDLRALGDDAIDAEMDACDSLIERRLGRRPAYFAYPYGHCDGHVRAVAGRRYAASFTTRLAYLSPGDPADALPRLDSHYLRHPAIMRSLTRPSGRGYIALRGLVRRLRGHE